MKSMIELVGSPEYARIKAEGYLIDTRGPYVTLINGFVARQFTTWMAAFRVAVDEIQEKRGWGV
jgi:hypothetical protein